MGACCSGLVAHSKSVPIAHSQQDSCYDTPWTSSDGLLVGADVLRWVPTCTHIQQQSSVASLRAGLT